MKTFKSWSKVPCRNLIW